MGMLKGVLLLVLSIVLILALLSFNIVFSINQLFYPDIYIQAFEKNDFYNNLGDMIGQGGDISDMPDSKQIVDEKITNTLAYLRSETEELDLKITMNKENLKDAFKQTIQDLPQCETGEQPVANNQVKCIPQGMDSSEFTDQIFSQQELSEEQMEYDLGEIFNKDNELEKFKGYISSSKIIFYISIIIAILFISIIVFLQKVNPKKAMLWIGGDFFIAGGLGLVLGLATMGFAEALSTREEFFFLSFAKDIVSPVAWKINIISIVFIIIAIALLVFAFLIKRVLGEKSPTDKSKRFKR